MEFASAQTLNVGVIGLGPQWRARYRDALGDEPERYRVRAVCDQVHQRAVDEAKLLQCEAAEGPTDLMETADLDAVLLIDSQWHGLWPLELACRMQMPAFCGPPLETDAAHAAALIERIEQSQLPIQVAFAARNAVPTLRLRRLLDKPFGPPRGCRLRVAGPAPRPLGEWLDWCVALIGESPTHVTAAGVDGFESVFLEFSKERFAAVQMERADEFAAHGEVIAENGRIAVEFPSRLRYRRGPARIRECWKHRPSAERRMLRRFHRLVMDGQTNDDGLDAARRAWKWSQAAQHSRAEAVRVALASPPEPGATASR